MPSLTFVMPHWLYWSGLVMFPLIAMFIVRRRAKVAATAERRVTLGIGYLMWLCGGFVGIHRYYVRDLKGLIYVPLFVAILYGNNQHRAARDMVSAARNDVMGRTFDVEHFTKRLADGYDGAAEKLAEAKQALTQVAQQFTEATAGQAQWEQITGWIALVIAALLLLDAILLPRLIRACAAREAAQAAAEPDREDIAAAGTMENPNRALQTPMTRVIDAISGFAGEFVAYWSLIAVFVYYYEVIARYVFNSPTNWAHESMFLMFGMQYLLSGAYALREDSHVRVDVVYVHLSDRAKLITDIVTSVFFFIFTATLLVTGSIFALDSIDVLEVSFTEWAIQYWPVKITIALGALLLILQGIAKLAKDVAVLRRRGA